MDDDTGAARHILERIPPVIDEIGNRTASLGGELYIVGGWVRDAILGKIAEEVDVATNLTPAQIKETFEGLGAIYDIGEKFGTVGLVAGDTRVEATTYRCDTYTPGSRHPRVSPAPGIAEDLSRRDFTINAVAVCVVPDRGALIDPFNGVEDIERGLIRTPGLPEARMAEDPLRMMRAVRFASQLNFRIDPELLGALRENAALLSDISWERRRDELEKTLVSPAAPEGLRTLVDTALMDHVCPEVSAMAGVDQPKSYHRADVLEHTLLTVGYVRPDPLLRRAALFHDLGKPLSKVTDPKVMFPGHVQAGVELTRQAMRRLRYGNDDTTRTAFLVRRHMRPILYEPTWTDATVRRMVRDCTLIEDGEVVVPLACVFELARADVEAGNLEHVPVMLGVLESLEERISKVLEPGEIERARSPLDGRELMQMFEREPGPWIREVKRLLEDKVVEGELLPDDKESAGRMAREFLERGEA